MVVLRDEKKPGNSRYLCVYFNGDGDLVFKGQDYGTDVKDFFQVSEYEFAQTIKKEYLPKLAELLGNTGEILTLIETHFSGASASNISSFMTENEIPVVFWSRMGD